MIRGWRGISLVVIASYKARKLFDHTAATYTTRYLSLLSDKAHKTSLCSI